MARVSAQLAEMLDLSSDVIGFTSRFVEFADVLDLCSHVIGFTSRPAEFADPFVRARSLCEGFLHCA